MSNTMKALVLTQHGDLDQLQVIDNHPRPAPTSGHVVIRVGASSFNYHDVFTVRGMPGISIPLPVVPGLDLAGTISAIGDGVTGWQVGDRVLINPLKPGVGLMGEMTDGGMAEYARVDAAQLIALPDNVSFAQAAALPVAYGTAHRMLITHNTVKAGDRVLILGASGGVGSACVVLAKRLGAEVIACAGSHEKAEALKALGADHVVNYRENDFSKWAIAAYGKPQRRSYEGGVDVVINFTGGDTWRPSLRCLKRGGLLLVCGATAGYDPQEDLRYIWSFELTVKGSNSFYADNLIALLDMVDRGEIEPLIDRVLPLEQAGEGLRLIRDREVLGKVIVTP
ncbi:MULTISPECIES: quinone oxidoreductase family protein [unclassified Brenneria]|uniref:quinone oxidoreductase family protein n=1 Tax=unclassified Brenneria TaxID=2634434 RepID=UPI0018F0E9DA|nr:zinc-binding dehydrogenase [Brenneria sp. L3-3C-1]MEE3642477.1 zinc-binding dehydrogenase [Brenneria sp. L3_3C_1]